MQTDDVFRNPQGFETESKYPKELGISTIFLFLYKLIGVQTNHGVEYFGGPAAPTH